jgi:broad specificity phosphatase PhoE
VLRNLDEIFAGEYEGMTYSEIEKRQPDEASLRKMDKIGYRYPRGESYFDLIARLDPLVHELESYKEPVLVVSHQVRNG